MALFTSSNSLAYKENEIYLDHTYIHPNNLINKYFGTFERWNNSLLSNNTYWHEESVVSTQIITDDKHYTMIMEVPGYDKNHIKISIKDNRMNISGNNTCTKNKKDDIKKNYNKSRKFNYSIKLNDDVNQKNISSNLKNGILTIIIPRVITTDNECQIIPIL